jgi:RIO kinase 1
MAKKSREKFKIFKNVFDEFTISTLFKLSSQGHFDEVLSPVMIGKESNVFLASTYDEDYVIVKIYRLHSCNFNKMYNYIRSDPRFMNIKNQRRLVIFRWVQREYRNLLIAREKILVPTPIAFANNVLVMESIGKNTPAPQLKDKLPDNVKEFSDKILNFITELAKLGIVHGDLSEFNILNHNNNPYFIDFSQGTSIKDPSVLDYLKRDIYNVSHFFGKHDVKINTDKIFRKIKMQIIKYI